MAERTFPQPHRPDNGLTVEEEWLGREIGDSDEPDDGFRLSASQVATVLCALSEVAAFRRGRLGEGPLARALREREHFAQALRYYADENNYNEDGAPVYESLSPPPGWVGEEYEATTKLDEGQLAREALGIGLELLHLEDQPGGPF